MLEDEFDFRSRFTHNKEIYAGMLIGNECVLAKPPAADRPKI